MVTKAQALAAGLARHEVDSHCRTGHWVRVARGVYLIDPSRPLVRRALIRAALLALGPGAVAVLDTAAELHGIAGFAATDEVHVSLPAAAARPALDRDPHIRAHQLITPAHRRCALLGIPVSDPLQTVADLVLRAERLTAVSILDSALNQGLSTPNEFAAIPELVRGRRGAVAARRHLVEADGRAESPLETRVRLRCVDGQVRPDTLQHVVRDRVGTILGVGDLAWLTARLIGEADGRTPHGQPAAIYRDRLRQNRLVNAGWQILRFTWKDTLDPAYIPAVVRAALSS